MISVLLLYMEFENLVKVPTNVGSSMSVDKAETTADRLSACLCDGVDGDLGFSFRMLFYSFHCGRTI